MTTPNETMNIGFNREDVVYDDDCIQECGKDEKLAFVNREDPEQVIHESCLYQLKPRERAEFIAIKDVPSGMLTAEEKVDAAVAASLDADEYDLDEPVEVAIHDDGEE